MEHWRHSILLKITTYFVLVIMSINPVMALQYQHLNTPGDFSNLIPEYSPKSFHIHVSQKEKIIALLRKQGYDVIPASIQDVSHFLDSGLNKHNKPIQLAANFNLKSVYEKKCPIRRVVCYADECEKYSDIAPENCSYDTTPYTKAPEPKQRSSSSISIGRNISIPRTGGGGSGNDAAAALLVVIGVVVIAALFVYAGKWVYEQINSDEDYYAYWWDIGTHYISLDTDAGEQGSFSGLKVSGGFVPNMHTNFGITFEVGQMHLNLLYNQATQPQRIQVDGSYWMIGPSVRWLLKNNDEEKFIHNTYVFLELLGGGSDRDEVDKMAMARIGINTAFHKNIRLGFHYGAFYLGLDEDKGFANDGENYWNMYGFELGYQF